MDRPLHNLTLIGGGVRSGKSAHALALARELGPRRAYLATAEGLDAEMRARIAQHRLEREAAFDTVEEPLALLDAMRALQADVCVVDCLTLWLSNHLLAHDSEARTLADLDAVLDWVGESSMHCIIVSNEVGMGVVPETELGRRFRDLSGRAHQRVAARAGSLYLAAMGCVLRLRPGPLSLVEPARATGNHP